MIPLVKTELKKIFTIRSTYMIIALTVFLALLIAGYAKGYKLAGGELGSTSIFQDSLTNSVMITVTSVSIVSLLLITHEYRYNTVLYWLISHRSRSLLLFSKVLAITIFSLLITVAISLIAVAATAIGANLAGHHLPAQSIAYSAVLWRILFYGWGYGMLSLLIGTLIRNQVAAIATVFIFPSTIESLLSLLLKHNTIYLPFSALGAVINKSEFLSYSKAAGVFLVYLLVGWLLAWWLFTRRDAN